MCFSQVIKSFLKSDKSEQCHYQKKRNAPRSSTSMSAYNTFVNCTDTPIIVEVLCIHTAAVFKYQLQRMEAFDIYSTVGLSWDVLISDPRGQIGQGTGVYVTGEYGTVVRFEESFADLNEIYYLSSIAKSKPQ